MCGDDKNHLLIIIEIISKQLIKPGVRVQDKSEDR